uniref:Reverse transcriptase domain-containing protein n=1 Tax=Fagus sylvatica TaxID=28930 RepID=A0A2N9IIB3_FAGSY
MLILSWNCRGLARPAAFRSLRALVRINNPDCIFLMETKSPLESMQEVTNLLGFSQAVFVPPVGTAGGICFGWKPGVDIEPTFQSQNLINLLVFSDPPNKPWMLSAIYGPPYKKKKRKFWEDMHQIASSFSGPWLCFGDFNEVLNQVDKRGGRPLTSSSTNGFNSLINQQGLVDLGFSGNPYTWTNKRHNFANIKERLDRAFSNTEWRTTFPRASVHHFPATSSDHNPIILNSTGFESTNPKPFRFEAIWTRDGSSTQVIKHAWDHLVFGSPLFKFIKKLKATKKDLIWWNKNCFGHLQTRNKSLSEAINSIQQLDPTESNLQKEKILTWEFNENLRREDLLWKQKSRVQWLTSPTLNTKFFHVSTIIRRRKNAIDFLKNENNEWLSNRNDIGSSFVQFYQNLFTSSNPQFPVVLDNLISPVISDEDNTLLCAIPTAAEIKQTLFSIGSNKSPGPDGMSAIFYKHYWEVINHDLIEAVTSFFTRGHILTEINHTFITLIPKSDKAAKSFLLNILRLHGFNTKWINWVNQCISTPSFSILLNGSPFGHFKSTRGLRQGDPLSPFLFIIGADILSRLLQKAESLGNLHGIKISPNCTPISHLQFADDLLIFSKANSSYASIILDCLSSYQAWSGQKINYSKSSVIFSKNTTGQTAANLCQLLNLKKSSPTTKHLGLPLELNRAKSSSFQDLIEKIQNRVAGWKTKLLSQAARTTLIANVAASIPSYTMSSLLLPKTICNKIDSTLRGFWWGSSPGKNHMCLKSWKSICQPKSYGGLGLRRSLDTNQALISKMGWSLATDENKTWVSLLKAKYLKGVPFMQISPSLNSSWLWKGILKSKTILSKGLCMKIGDGQHTPIWDTPWIPTLENFIPSPSSTAHPIIHRVAELINPDTFQWDRA